MEIEKIQGILIDLDGTLLDTEKVQFDSFIKALDFFNVKIPEEDYPKYIGRSIKQVEEAIIENYNLKIRPGAIVKKRRKIIMDIFKHEKLPMQPFAKEMLTFLEKRYPLAICTAGEKDEVMAKLKVNGLYHFFDSIITASEVKKSKPDPETYIVGARKINISPENCIAIEDTYSGMLSAKGAGTTCFVIPNHYERDKKDFSMADKILDSLKEVIDIFENAN